MLSPSSSLQRVCITTVARRWKHSVRVILTADLPEGAGYNGDVLNVKAGYARNFLIPNKLGLYATPENFERLGKQDADAETVEEQRARKEREALEESNEELKAADLLTHYLRNKTLKIWRHVDPTTNTVHPGLVNAENVREKLSKQLLIDLDENEKVTLRTTPVVSHSELTEQDIIAMMDELSEQEEKDVQIRQLGDFIAKLSLEGGYSVPLKFSVLKR